MGQDFDKQKDKRLLQKQIEEELIHELYETTEDIYRIKYDRPWMKPSSEIMIKRHLRKVVYYYMKNENCNFEEAVDRIIRGGIISPLIDQIREEESRG